MHLHKFPLNSCRQLCIIFFAILLIGTYLPSAQADTLPTSRTIADSTEHEIKEMALLMTSVASFKETARTDYTKALLAFPKNGGWNSYTRLTNHCGKHHRHN